MGLSEAIEEYRYHLTMVEHKSERTIDSYLRDLSHYAAYLDQLDIHAVEDITEGNVQDFLLELREDYKAAVLIAGTPSSAGPDAVHQGNEEAGAPAALFK